MGMMASCHPIARVPTGQCQWYSGSWSIVDKGKAPPDWKNGGGVFHPNLHQVSSSNSFGNRSGCVIELQAWCPGYFQISISLICITQKFVALLPTRHLFVLWPSRYLYFPLRESYG